MNKIIATSPTKSAAKNEPAIRVPVTFKVLIYPRVSAMICIELSVSVPPVLLH